MYRISGARKGLSEDIRGRQRRYVLSMSIRTVCFLLAVVLSGPLRWVMLAAALFLPYIAVVVANAGREPTSDPPPDAVPPMEHRAIEPPPDAVVTHSERRDVSVVPEDAWIVPDDGPVGPRDGDAENTPEDSPENAPRDTADTPDNPPGRDTAGDGSRPSDATPKGNRQ
ncbi:DUF3099 domain-containing protein [Yinghuangia sp. YIM S10712]|uniref:DUF3099 domain-containing protein n=1 Tax=Yinghuangia sp. YIM S10712 TaxID=3436930 RepID=UPI003F536074